MNRASEWLRALEAGEVAWLQAAYGSAPLGPRAALLRRAVAGFLDRFGDRPVRVVRAPGRLNLRGMHVDTHGGYLNLVTHQREVVVVTSPASDPGVCRWCNDAEAHEDFKFSPEALMAQVDAYPVWSEMIRSDAVRERVGSKPGAWRNYVEGALLRAAQGDGGVASMRLDGFVASDLPEGAGLSSSAALSLAVFLSARGTVGAAEQILATRDAEWYTGARTGTCDPAAMVLGEPGKLVNVSLLAEKFSVEGARRVTWPSDEVAVVTAHTHTTRSLSGADRIAYTKNRFAYSVALEVFRQEMQHLGYADVRIEMIDRLAHINPEILGGLKQFAALLFRVPEYSSIEGLRARYELPELDALIEQYFAGVPEEELPEEIGVRGPLLYGIAESHRAAQFASLLEEGQYARLGELMRRGHDGDRVRAEDGGRFERVADAATVAHLGDDSVALTDVPGDYGASSPVLDALVDAAHGAGAYGACLTGAGIAGSVIALCSRPALERVRAAWTARLCSPDYTALAGFGAPLEESVARGSVVENHIVAPAGELRLRG